MSTTYRPQLGSVAYQVIEFLTTHPEEELTREDVSVKYDTPAKQVHSLLAIAIESGALKRRDTDDGEIAYSLGTGVPSIKPSRARNPSLRPDALIAGANLGKRKSALPPPDLTALEIRSDVPMPTGVGRAKTDWTVLLKRIEVGQSTMLDRRHRAGLTKACTEWKKAGKGVFSVATVSDSQIGIWRVE